MKKLKKVVLQFYMFTFGILVPSALVVVGHILKRVWRGLRRGRHITAAEAKKIGATVFWVCFCTIASVIWGVLAFIFEDYESKEEAVCKKR